MAPVLTDTELPALYRGADEAAQTGRRAFEVQRGLQLAALVVAATAGAVTVRVGALDWAGAVALTAFLAAGGLQYRLVTEEPQRTWYDGRAAAESVKDLAWRYAMRAEPFQSTADADAALITRLRQITEQVAHLALPTVTAEQVTPLMRQLREESLGTRRDSYVHGRVLDQLNWYGARAAQARHRAGGWRRGTAALVTLGVIAGLGKAFGILDLDFLGVAATAVGSATAWLQLQQYETLAVSYGITAQELGFVQELADEPSDEDEWSKFVNDAEQAISREHQLWRASRTSLGRLASRAGP